MRLLTRAEIKKHTEPATPAAKRIELEPPFDEEDKLESLLGSVHLNLTNKRVLYTGSFDPEEGVRLGRHERAVDLRRGPFLLRPEWFVQLEVAQQIKLGSKILGTFGVVTSRLNPSGIIIQCGHVIPEYDGPLLFGVYNAGGDTFRIEEGDTLVRIYFTELDSDIVPSKTEATHLAALEKERERKQLDKEIASVEASLGALTDRLAALKAKREE